MSTLTIAACVVGYWLAGAVIAGVLERKWPDHVDTLGRLIASLFWLPGGFLWLLAKATNAIAAVVVRAGK